MGNGASISLPPSKSSAANSGEDDGINSIITDNNSSTSQLTYDHERCEILANFQKFVEENIFKGRKRMLKSATYRVKFFDFLQGHQWIEQINALDPSAQSKFESHLDINLTISVSHYDVWYYFPLLSPLYLTLSFILSLFTKQYGVEENKLTICEDVEHFEHQMTDTNSYTPLNNQNAVYCNNTPLIRSLQKQIQSIPELELKLLIGSGKWLRQSFLAFDKAKISLAIAEVKENCTVFPLIYCNKLCKKQKNKRIGEELTSLFLSNLDTDLTNNLIIALQEGSKAEIYNTYERFENTLNQKKGLKYIKLEPIFKKNEYKYVIYVENDVTHGIIDKVKIIDDFLLLFSSFL